MTVELAERPAADCLQRKILCSYHFFKKADMGGLVDGFGEAPLVFADSGGFSAFSQGISISVDDYAWWLRRWRQQIDVAANLDDLHDPVVTYRNQKRLEAAGLHPIPVFHLGSHFDWLRRYLDEGHRYLALGKDSSSWTYTIRYGDVRLWDNRHSRFRVVDVGDQAGVYGRADLVREHGFDPAVFADRSQYSRLAATHIGMVCYGRFEMWLRRRHRRVEFGSYPPGPHVFLAANPGNVTAIASPFEREKRS